MDGPAGSQNAWFSLVRGKVQVRSIASFFELFFEGVFFRFFSMSGRFWEVLGGWKKPDFGIVFGGQNDEKSRKCDVEKRVFFQLRFFGVFS